MRNKVIQFLNLRTHYVAKVLVISFVFFAISNTLLELFFWDFTNIGHSSTFNINHARYGFYYLFVFIVGLTVIRKNIFSGMLVPFVLLAGNLVSCQLSIRLSLRFLSIYTPNKDDVLFAIGGPILFSFNTIPAIIFAYIVFFVIKQVSKKKNETQQLYQSD